MAGQRDAVTEVSEEVASLSAIVQEIAATATKVRPKKSRTRLMIRPRVPKKLQA